jgi:2-phosphosulfolactate phosphatase
VRQAGPNSFVIDCFPEAVARHRDDHRLVVVDVIRATTLAITALAQGRRCLIASTPELARDLGARIGPAVLAGEIAGDKPEGFDMNNSPAELDRRTDVERPIIIVSSSGTQLMAQAGLIPGGAEVACLRNARATARHLIGRHRRIALIGAGSRGEFRDEDQMCCAWIGDQLLNAGYIPESEKTQRIVERWRGVPVEALAKGASVAYLRRTGQEGDFDYISRRIDDLDLVASIRGQEVSVSADPAWVGRDR